MSGISSMPPISSLHRYLADAHESLSNKKRPEHDDSSKVKEAQREDRNDRKGDQAIQEFDVSA